MREIESIGSQPFNRITNISNCMDFHLFYLNHPLHCTLNQPTNLDAFDAHGNPTGHIRCVGSILAID